jgi:hypothetical protein
LGGEVELVEPRQLRVRGTVIRARRLDAGSPIAYGYSDTMAVYFNRGPLLQVDTIAARGTEQRRDSATVADLLRMRPRVVVGLHRRADSLLVSGLLDGAGELAGRAAVVDARVGAGHVVMFAIRPWWRWETQGSFALGFNAILHWNDLDAGWPPLSASQPVDRARGVR